MFNLRKLLSLDVKLEFVNYSVSYFLHIYIYI